MADVRLRNFLFKNPVAEAIAIGLVALIETDTDPMDIYQLMQILDHRYTIDHEGNTLVVYAIPPTQEELNNLENSG